MKGSHERDRSIERLLRQSTQVPPQRASDACLDAEILAAWVDGGLTAPALERAQSHVATCGRCQAVLATTVRTHVVAEPAPTPRRWLAWLVPLTAAAAVVAFWVAVPGERQLSRERQAGQESKTVASETQLARESAPAPGNATAEANAVASKDAASAAPPAEARERLADASRFEATASPVPSAAGPPPASPAARESSGASTTTEAAAKSTPSTIVGMSPSPAAPAAAAAPMLAARAPVVPGPSTPAAPATLDAISARIVVVSPNPAVRWRLAGSAVESSTDAGTSWTAVLPDAGAEVLAGASPSPAVCWVVGRRGGVWLTADGGRFVRLAFPETMDLSAVRARDARSALVSASDGRIFGTTDGGVTWTPRPVQDFQTAPF